MMTVIMVTVMVVMVMMVVKCDDSEAVMMTKLRSDSVNSIFSDSGSNGGGSNGSDLIMELIT